MTGKPYSALGGAFEYLNDDCGYDEWSQYLIKKLKSLNAGRVGVDMGCGNGYFTRALIRAGYSVIGMDVSEEMLSAAVEIARREGVRAEFLYGDITKLKLNAKPDFIVAVNDCLNYVPQTKLAAAFSKVCQNLKNGGLFIFDISSEQKLRGDIGNNLFADDGEEVTYLWFNELAGDKINMDITVFTRGADGKYTRADERQTQYIHSENDVVSALESIGFKVETEGHLGGTKEKRINFICRKI